MPDSKLKYSVLISCFLFSLLSLPTIFFFSSSAYSMMDSDSESDSEHPKLDLVIIKNHFDGKKKPSKSPKGLATYVKIEEKPDFKVNICGNHGFSPQIHDNYVDHPIIRDLSVNELLLKSFASLNPYDLLHLEKEEVPQDLAISRLFQESRALQEQDYTAPTLDEAER